MKSLLHSFIAFVALLAPAWLAGEPLPWLGAGLVGMGCMAIWTFEAAGFRRYLRAEGGRSAVKAALDEIHHHYATDESARAGLVEHARKGIIPGIRVEREGRRLNFVLEPKASTSRTCKGASDAPGGPGD